MVHSRDVRDLSPELRHLDGSGDPELELVVRPLEVLGVAGYEKFQEEMPELCLRARISLVHTESWREEKRNSVQFLML